MAAFILALCAVSAHAGISMVKAAEWPFFYPTLFLKGGVNAVTSGETLLFWAVGDTVAVIDKSTFTEVGTLRVSTSTAIQDMVYDDDSDTLYIAAGYDTREGSGGLQFADISDPSHPAVTVVFDQAEDNPGSTIVDDTDALDVPKIDARGVGIYNGALFLADDNFGLRVLDVDTDPANPVEIPLATQTVERISGYKQPNINGSYDATGGYVNLSVYPFDEKIYAFVLDFYHGIKVFDVTDPTVIDDPVLKDTRTSIWFGSVSLLSDLFVTETGGRLTAYVTGTNTYSSESAISRMDVTFDVDLPLVNLGRYVSEDDESRSVCASGDYAYVACGGAGLKIVDISGVPAEGDVLSYPLSGTYTDQVDFTYAVHTDGGFLYLATAESGLVRLDMSNPAAPASPATLASQVTADDVCVSGDYTYALDRQRGLRIFDTTEPSYPLLLSFLELTGPSTDLYISGNHAYIASGTGFLRVVDVSDKVNPVLTASTVALTDPSKLCVSGTILYAAGGAGGVHRVDISSPLALSSLSSIRTAGDAISVFVEGNRVYVAEGGAGVEIFDLSDLSGPALLISAADARDVTVLTQGTSVYALVADGDEGLDIYDITGFTAPLPAPVTVNTMDTENPTAFSAVSVVALENTVFVGLGDDGILVLDLSDPGNPDEIVHNDSADYAGDIVPYLIGGTTYLTVAERGAGMQIFYLYDSQYDEDTEDLVPSIDSGCFIGGVSGNISKTGWREDSFGRALRSLLCDIMTGDSL